MSVNIKNYNKIIGAMQRAIMARLGINDFNVGSVINGLLEAAAQEDANQYISLISILDSISLDNISGIELDEKGEEYSLSRRQPTKSTGFVNIGDSSFTKISTSVFAGSSSPIAGQTFINVGDASEMTAGDQIYIGRGSRNFEGPIEISSIDDNISFWTINLLSPLTKNHNTGETVILAQGGNRTIQAGATVKTTAATGVQQVSFSLRETVTLEDGEDTLENVGVICDIPGVVGNVGLGAINSFTAPPFSDATVRNPTAFTSGSDVELDSDYRERIKTHIQSLSRGTVSAIIEALVGLFDPNEKKRIVSAGLVEGASEQDITRVYIDDGSGFEPSFVGKGSEKLVDNADGTEKLFQLSKYPLVKAQLISSAEQPYIIPNGSNLIVRVNNLEEEIFFEDSDFDNPNSVLATEVAEAINNKATLIEARTANELRQVVIFAKQINNETIQVVGGTANDYLAFPEDEKFTLKLYEDDRLLSRDGETAFLESPARSDWSTPVTVPAANASSLAIKIDNKPVQYLRIEDDKLEIALAETGPYIDISATNKTFVDLGTTMDTASVDIWARVLDQMIIGADVTANNDKINITSNLEKDSDSRVEILGGSIIGEVFELGLSVGKPSEYTLNRFTGQIELKDQLVAGSDLSCSSINTRASVLSSENTLGLYDLSLVEQRKSLFYTVVDGDSEIRNLVVPTGSKIAVTNPAGNTYRYTFSNLPAEFDISTLQIGDFIFIGYWHSTIEDVVALTSQSYLSTPNTGRALLTAGNIGDTVDITNPSLNVVRYTLLAGAKFSSIPRLGDRLYIPNHATQPLNDANTSDENGFEVIDFDPDGTWIEVSNALGFFAQAVVLVNTIDMQINSPALFKVTGVGATYFEIENANGIVEGPFNIGKPEDFQAFVVNDNAVPQKAEFLPVTTSITSVVSQINSQLIGATGRVHKTTFLRLNTNTYSSDSSIHVPIAFSGATSFEFSNEPQTSEVSHIAYQETGTELGYRIPRQKIRTTDSDDLTEPYTSLIDSAGAFLTGVTQYNNWIRLKIDDENQNVKSNIVGIAAENELLLRDNSLIDNNGLFLPNIDFVNYTKGGSTYIEHYPFDFNGKDTIVVVMDGNEQFQTFNIPLYRNGEISAHSGGVISNFDANDTDASAAGEPFSGTIWDDYSFADYKIWFRARNYFHNVGAETQAASLTIGNLTFTSEIPGIYGNDISVQYRSDGSWAIGAPKVVVVDKVIYVGVDSGVTLESAVLTELNANEEVLGLVSISGVPAGTVTSGAITPLTGGTSAEDQSIIVQAQEYGPNGERIKARIAYQESENLDPEAFFSLDSEANKLSILLGTGATQATGTNKFSRFYIVADKDTIKLIHPTVSGGTAPAFDPSMEGKLLKISSPNGSWNTLNEGVFKIKSVLSTDYIEVYGAGFTQKVATAGTASITSGDLVVTGIGTAWDTPGNDQLFDNDYIYLNGELHKIDTVDNDTQLTLCTPHVAGAAGVVLYNMEKVELQSDTGMTVFQLDATANTVTALNTAINGTNIVNEIVEASLGDGHTGSNVIEYASGDDMAIALNNGESVLDLPNPAVTATVNVAWVDGISTYTLQNDTWKYIPEKNEYIKFSNFANAENNGLFKVLDATSTTIRVNNPTSGVANNETVATLVPSDILTTSFVTLKDGQSWIKEFRPTGGRDFVLKRPLEIAEETFFLHAGQTFKLIPATALNLLSHLTKPSITALSTNANITRSSKGDKVQISSIVVGATGEVWVSGGRGNISVIAPSKASASNGDYIIVSVPDSLVNSFHIGQYVKLQNNVELENKNSYDSNTEVEVAALIADPALKAYILNPRNANSPIQVTITNNGDGTATYAATAASAFYENAQVGDVIYTGVGTFVNPENNGYFTIVSIIDEDTALVNNPLAIAEGPVATGDPTVLAPFFSQWVTSIDNTTEIRVLDLGNDIYRFEYTGVGTAPDFFQNFVRENDWVVIGSPFSSGNQGKFRVIGMAEGQDYFEIENPNGVEETATLSSASSLKFYAHSSAFAGDKLFIGTTSDPTWFSEENQIGLVEIEEVGFAADGRQQVVISQDAYQPETVTLGTNYKKLAVQEAEPFEAFYMVENVILDPNDADYGQIWLNSPYTGGNGNSFINGSEKIKPAGSTQIFALNKTGMPITPRNGVDAYEYWTGLLGRAYKVIYGSQRDRLNFPGVKAAGPQIEIIAPLLQRVGFTLDVKSKVSLNLVTDNIKTAVLAYIASLGVGEDIVFSEIIRRVKNVNGVDNVAILDPIPQNASDPRIVIQPNERAIAFESDIEIV